MCRSAAHRIAGKRIAGWRGGEGGGGELTFVLGGHDGQFQAVWLG